MLMSNGWEPGTSIKESWSQIGIDLSIQQFFAFQNTFYVAAYLLAISTGSDKSNAYQHVKLIGDKASTDFIRLEDATVDNWEAYS